MKVALCVGVNYYAHANSLNKCVQYAHDLAETLAVNDDGSMNFEIIERHAADEASALSRQELRMHAERLFSLEVETALFYFTGHGSVTEYGGYLCTSEVAAADDGLSMDVLMHIVARSRAINKIIILDCCHAGTLGQVSMSDGFCKLPPNTIILAASTSDDVAYEGVFTPLVVNALNGGAMNLLGEVTPGSVYDYVDHTLGVFYQRPVFKANIRSFVCLRKNRETIALDKLHMLPVYFPEKGYLFHMMPGMVFDPNFANGNPFFEELERIYSILRAYEKANLVAPIGAENLYMAAVKSRPCRLTRLGQYYWQLVASGRI